MYLCSVIIHLVESSVVEKKSVITDTPPVYRDTLSRRGCVDREGSGSETVSLVGRERTQKGYL